LFRLGVQQTEEHAHGDEDEDEEGKTDGPRLIITSSKFWHGIAWHGEIDEVVHSS